nr:unnamed protein product [Spirometra erinaceieuropaei]
MKRKYYGFHRSTIYKRLLRQSRAYYAAMEEQRIASTSLVANDSPELQMPELMPEVLTELPVLAGSVDTVEGRCLTTDLREFCLRRRFCKRGEISPIFVYFHAQVQLPNIPVLATALQRYLEGQQSGGFMDHRTGTEEDRHVGGTFVRLQKSPYLPPHTHNYPPPKNRNYQWPVEVTSHPGYEGR